MYSEFRPAYVGEPISVSCTIEGSGSIAGTTYAGTLIDPTGEEVTGAVTVTIADAPGREITISIEAQDTRGDYTLSVRRTDDATDLVVLTGTVELTDPTKRVQV